MISADKLLAAVGVERQAAAIRRFCPGRLAEFPLPLTPVVLRRDHVEEFYRSAAAVVRWYEALPLETIRSMPALPWTRADEDIEFGAGAIPLMRLDGILTDSGSIRWIEANIGDPSGFGYEYGMVRMLEQTPFMRQLHDAELLCAAPSHRHCVLGRAGVEQPTVILLMDRQHPLNADVELLARSWTELGGPTPSVVDPREPRLEGSTLYAGDRRIDVVVRDTVEEWYGDSYVRDTEQLICAAREGYVEVINPLRTARLESKALLQEASRQIEDVQESYAVSLENAAVVKEACGSPGSWVLKPLWEYGGRGVIFGNDASPDTWRTLLRPAADLRSARCIIQKRIDSQRHRLWVVRDGRPSFEERHLVLSVWVIDGRPCGMLARSASEGAVNVTSGAILHPVAVVD
ncbi:MAG: hypothetical protein AAF219_04245 [Myxococcota bacterium]